MTVQGSRQRLPRYQSVPFSCAKLPDAARTTLQVQPSPPTGKSGIMELHPSKLPTPHLHILAFLRRLLVWPWVAAGSVYKCHGDPYLPQLQGGLSSLVGVSSGAIVARGDHAGVAVGVCIVVIVGIQSMTGTQ